MRIKSLDIGVESIGRWQLDDEVHLPKETSRGPLFLPHYRPLDEILRRPSLDERVPRMLQPDTLDPDLLEPATLTDARLASQQIFLLAAEQATGKRRTLLELAAEVLEDDAEMDEEVRRALGALLRG